MDEGIYLGTITITHTLDTDGDEIVELEHDHALTVVQLLGILDLCRDTILHPPVDDEDE